MKKFEFDNKKQDKIEIEVDNKKFNFNPKKLEVKLAMDQYIKRMSPVLEKMQDKNLNNDEQNDLIIQSCIICRDVIISFLGKKAYAIIFGNRNADYEEHIKFTTFLFESIKEYVQTTM